MIGEYGGGGGLGLLSNRSKGSETILGYQVFKKHGKNNNNNNDDMDRRSDEIKWFDVMSENQDGMLIRLDVNHCVASMTF